MKAVSVEPIAGATPALEVHAKPPSPKRLSRKVLLAGALAVGAIVAFALVSGLSDRSGRRSASEESVSASANPPESVQQAQADYIAEDLPAGQADASGDPSAQGSELPASVEREDGNAATPASVAARQASGPTPEEAAQISAIMFSRDRSQIGDDGEHRLNSRLVPPGSRYELQSGHVISAALLTALNSDLSGRVIAQVTAPVYDSVSGEHLLIPQGARLIGAYEGSVRYGDNRLFLVWNRLILPNGWSLNLREMAATDGSGASGLSDRTDNHFDRLGVAIGLSAIVSVIAGESEDDGEGGRSLSQSVGDAAAAQAAQTGGRIVDRELTVRPTLRVRAGAPVRVLVTRDIQLRPYQSASSELQSRAR